MSELGTRLAVSICRFLVTANVVRSSPTLVTVMKEVLRSSETLFRTRAIWRSIPEDAVLHSHHLQNLQSYIHHVVCKIMSNNMQGM
jgi:hypothetical protein